MLKNLWGHLTKGHQKNFYLLLVLMFMASIAEMISMGAIIPFLGVLTAPEQIYQYQAIQPIIHFFEITSSNQLAFLLTFIFIVAILLSGIIRLMLLYFMTKLSFKVGVHLSVNIYRRTLYQKYSVHVERNSSEIINGIMTKINTVVGGVITPVLYLISSIILITGIIVALFLIDPVVTLISSGSFGVLYWLIIRYTRKHIKENSLCIASQSTKAIKSLQEGLGGIRDILIDGNQQFYCQLYENSDLPMRRAISRNSFINGSPKFVLEAIGMVFISGFAYVMTTQQNDMVIIIPILGAFALGAQRLLPALQQAYSSYGQIKGAQASFADVLELLGQELPVDASLSSPPSMVFNKSIVLKDIGFRYTEKSPWVLKGINLEIKKGSCVGFIGSTGSGKSTMLDIIMGLLSPTVGGIVIDNQLVNNKNRWAWQTHIAHVPQNIYLSDGTIEENIAFGVSRELIDYKQIEKAAKQAEILDLIKSWKDGYQTVVGECGAKLSGGQRQRIGIARALYKRADVLIFDEATSALDNKTEQSVIKAIGGLKQELTVLIIAHRLTTLEGCDRIIKLNNKNMIQEVSYKDIASLNGQR